MGITQNGILKWFDAYFKAFNNNAGPLATVVNMKKYFTDDLEFWGYNQVGRRPSSREALLMSMVHPGLHEHLTPLEYIVDLNQMIVVVQFQVQFSDEPSGKIWPPKQTSTHYHLVLDRNNEPRIKKIVYFMEQRPAEEGDYRDLWAKYRQQELSDNRQLAEQLK